MGSWFSQPKPPPPTTAEIFMKEMTILLFAILHLCVMLLLISFFSIVISRIIDYFECRKLKKKIVQGHKKLKFHWKDIYVDEDIKKMLLDNVTRPLAIRQNPSNVALSSDATLPKGLLFSGPSGTGKTLLAMIVAKESKCNFLNIDASDFKDCYYGESEKKVKRIFAVAKAHQPCIVFIDEIDTIMSARTPAISWDVENSVKGVFLTHWDGIHSKKNNGQPSSVVIIGATNRPKALDAAFLRRLDLNIEIPLPNLGQRHKIMDILLKDCCLEDGFNAGKIAEKATGFTGADLAEAVRYAIMNSSADYHKQLEAELKNKPQENIEATKKTSSWFGNSYPIPFFKRSFTTLKRVVSFTAKVDATRPRIPLTMAVMENSVAHSKKSRAGGGGVGGLDSIEMMMTSSLLHPNDIDITWDDIAGCNDVIQDIKNNLILPMKVQMNNKFKVSKFLQCPKGILFHGPPGSGKTLLAKAVARHSGCSFINLKPSMLESKWYGETSKRVEALFSVAEKYQPCIIFMDEIDAFLRERRDCDSEGSAGKKAQFLSLLDGILTDPKKVIILMGATNRLANLDPALLRRLTLKFHIDTPDRNKRRDILQLLLKDEKLSEDVCLDRIVDSTEEMTGADLKDVLRATIVEALKEYYADIVDQDDVPLKSTETTTEKKDDFFKTIHITVSGTSQINNNMETVNDKSKTDINAVVEILDIQSPIASVSDLSPKNELLDIQSPIASVSALSPENELLESPSVIVVELKMTHFVTAIENFKKSKANATNAPAHMYC